MPEPRYRRRKEDRPDEIADAAFAVFAEKGYAGARVEEVARRAGVSKGLLYLYFRTKEELFKAVIMRVISPRVDVLDRQLAASDATAEELLRGPVQTFMQNLPNSPARVVLKLMVSEASRYPDLVEFYWENVASRGLVMIRRIIDRGVASGEFRATAVSDVPQLVIGPMVVAVIWKIIFADRELDSNAMVEAHIDMLIAYLRQ